MKESTKGKGRESFSPSGETAGTGWGTRSTVSCADQCPHIQTSKLEKRFLRFEHNVIIHTHRCVNNVLITTDSLENADVQAHVSHLFTSVFQIKILFLYHGLL